MFTHGQRVWSPSGQRAGIVSNYEGGVVYVVWDDNPSVTAAENPDVLAEDQPLPGPSDGQDIVHAAMLRHAVNAGAAVTALEIIRREAKCANNRTNDPGNAGLIAALRFIEQFADDVLSQVLPALPDQAYNHVPCRYCGRMLDDGESHLHGGAPNPSE